MTPDFCNLDYKWRPGIDVVWDVSRGALPFEDGYFGGIFTEHMVEHIEFYAALALLKECRRVLRHGCTLRVVVPDGEIYLSEYAKFLRGEATQMPYSEADKTPWNPSLTPIVSVNRLFYPFHKFIWDFPTLREALRYAGFAEIEKRRFGEGADPLLTGRDSSIREVESLYVEAW